MLPEDVKNLLDTQEMLRDDFTYGRTKGCDSNLAQKVAKAPVPMDISPLAPAPPIDEGTYWEPKNQPDPSAPPPLDLFGRAPAGGATPGKGNGKGEKGKGSKGDRTGGKHTR